MDYFSAFWEGFYRDVANKVPYALWGVGCCDLKESPSHISQNLMINIVRQSRLCVVRDRLTWDFLKDCHLPDPVPCPSLSIIESAGERGKGILHVVHAGLIPEVDQSRIVALLKDEASKTNSVYMECRNRIDPPTEKMLDMELERYRTSDVIVSSRLHGCILAVGMGKKLIAISGDRKIENFMSAVGLQDWVLGLEDLERLPEKLNILHQQQTTSEFVRQTRKDNMDVSRKIHDIICKLDILKKENRQ